ncbi:MAG: thioredoxin domain-containing protein [Myxococcales bacterium]|nr:thioredoxin domain-containing protein [Myxococcota bacterium]MDW8280717.1 thioredoxin domain-containing protein [Myxococcales bacterium]
MNKSTAIAGMLIALVIGYFIGSHTGARKGDSAPEVSAAAPDPSVERYKIQVGNAPVSGPSTAKVTIIEFSDYQCPFCARVEPTLEQIKKAYGKEVRIAFKHNPLSFHPNALPAARAAMAAREQGEDKFWRFHERLFKNQDKLDEQTFIEHARAIGLNVDKFKADLKNNEARYNAQIQADQAEAAKFGARGTPSFFINGRPLSGAQPFESFKKIIDEELAAADRLLAAGVARESLYAAFIQNAKEQAQAPEAPTRPSPPPQDDTIYKVPVGNAYVKGPETAKVTIIEFSDFQCPFCARVVATLDKILQTYGQDVRIVFKHNPLSFHDKAALAAEAALAAGEQGKFWEMHDLLFKNQQALDRADLEKYAAQLGLNMAQFKAALDSGRFKKQVEADQAEAAKFGARGTPTFFINGRPLRGAQPFENFKAIIDKEMERAAEKLRAGIRPQALYAELTKDGLDRAKEEAPRPQAAEPQDQTVYKALVRDAPVRGAKDAKVTIVYWSDFQCPFCKRVEPTLKQILDTYGKDVRIAFKQLPLPFHKDAHLAAQASLAAKEQGKFWEMHDKLFANQQALSRADLEKYAQEIGLDMGRFRAALDSGKFKDKVDEEVAEGNKIGARGTPSFFINGRSLVGAQPFEVFKARIEEAIKEADALMKARRIPASRIYDEIMKDAKAEVAAAQRGDDELEDKKVYQVDPGNGPSWGDRNAPVTIVEFSDFQCPFCARVLPTLKQIKEKYPRQVRIVWRNYPLPFHKQADLAAEAALAAHEQGKFWEMHDKLFANQQSLERPDLEKYAQEIGLDMGRFKAALDSRKFKARVEADVQYGNSLAGGSMGTPTFFINGRKLAGAYPFESFDKLIKEALAKK